MSEHHDELQDPRPAGEDGFSPALGGHRAPEPEPAPAEPAAEAEAEGAEPASASFDFSFFTSLFEGTTTTSHSVTTNGDADALIDAFAGFLTSAAQTVEQRLPQTLAALEGLVDAVESALEPLFTEEEQHPPTPPSA